MKLMVIDGNSIVNRAFYGMHPLSTRDGRPTNAIFGFLNILQRLQNEGKPDALCVTFDLKAPTFRHLAYEGYKATRHAMPDDLASQIPVLKQVLDAMNIPRYELEGWEADDLIGTISARCEAAGWECDAVTGDKDALQLVSDQTHVLLVSTRMGNSTTRTVTPESFREEYGFDPIHMIDLKALMGDSSDNIPGVTGIGEKTAMPLIQIYQTVENLYDHMPDILVGPDTPAKPGVVKKLEAGRAQAEMSRDLATIRRDAPIEFRPEDALLKSPDNDALYEIFLDLEFAKFIEKYHLTAPQGAVAAPDTDVRLPGSCEMVERPDRCRELLDLWRSLDCVQVLALPSLDTVCVGYRSGEGESQAALLRADRLDGYRDALEQLFSPGIKKAGHDVKTLCRHLLEAGIEPGGFEFDTAVAAYLLAPTDGSYDLEKLGMSCFNREFPKTRDYLSEGAFDPLSDNREPAQAMAAHVSLIGALQPVLSARLEELGMGKLYREIELPLCRVLAEIEQAGFLLDKQALLAFGETLSTRIADLQNQIFELAGGPFNINSTQQLGRLLFVDLGLPPVKKTKTGYSTSAEVLEKLRGKHPIIDLILEYRQLTKLQSTYVDGLAPLAGPDGRIHTTFQNTVTATGRLSSTDPNLQNIPVRTDLGAELRRMFVAPEGSVLVDADYSQIELRLLACISGDEAMIEGFNSGEDVHTITASQVFRVPVSEVTPQMRRSAKAVNFGIVYGISPYSLSQDIGVTVAQAKDYMDRYFAHYAGVKAYMDNIIARAKEDGYVTTLFGRRRWVPELKSANFNTRSFGERVALNTPIQGTAADIIKLAMIRVRDRLKSEGLAARLVLQVHDELIVECPEEEAERVAALLREEMEGVVQLQVPLIAETGTGRTWADAH